MADLNWVTARAKCSILIVFNEFRLEVEEDVKIINSTSRPPEYPLSSFAVRSNVVSDYFVVFQEQNANARVDFNCEVDRITVKSGERTFSVTLTLDNAGQCKMRVNDGEPMERWQVRRMMLEDLFFQSRV